MAQHISCVIMRGGTSKAVFSRESDLPRDGETPEAVHEAARPAPAESIECRIGHPGGVITTEVKVALSGNAYTVERATLGRTARRILDGTVYVPDAAR